MRFKTLCALVMGFSLIYSCNAKTPPELKSNADKVKVVESNPVTLEELTMPEHLLTEEEKAKGTEFSYASHVWSPDGKKIAFLAHNTALDDSEYGFLAYEICVMDADRSNWKRLTANMYSAYKLWTDSRPVWSPDSKKIAFISNRDYGLNSKYNGVYIMGADGSNQKSITWSPDAMRRFYDFPVWSPDATKIACIGVQWNPFSCMVYVIDLMEWNQVSVAEFSDRQINHVLQWHGDKILFSAVEMKKGGPSSYSGVLDRDVYITDLEGNVKQLSDSLAVSYSPRWTPDGRITFKSDSDSGGVSFYIINPDGTNLQKIKQE